MNTFPERLKEARLKIGLTQELLGFELNVTKSSISAWEKGREAPSFRLLPRLSEVLQSSLDVLICGEDDNGAREHVISTLNDEEARLLTAYRRLPLKRRQALLDMLD